MKKRRGRYFRVGDTIKVYSEEHMKRVINDLARRGVDAKPVFGEMLVEVIDVDRRK